MMISRNIRMLAHQRGVTLVVTMVMLVMMTLISIYTAKSMVVEQQIAANDYRGKQAFEAADGGLEYGIALLNNYGVNKLSDDNDDLILEVDTNNDGVGDTTSFPVTLSSGASFSVSFYLLAAGDMDSVRVQSNGLSDDGSGNRTVSVITSFLSALVNPAPYSLITRGSVNFGGNVEITNTHTDQTIWSGGSTSLTGSAGTTTSDPANDGIVENDAGLAGTDTDTFFSAFFGASKSEIKAMSTVFTGAGNYKNIIDGLEGQIIWIDGDGGAVSANAQTEVGSADNPVILIIDNFSDLHLNGGFDLWGMLYIAGNWYNSGGGNATIHGAAVAEGNLQSTGTPDIIYDPDMLGTSTGSYVKVPGTWTDF